MKNDVLVLLPKRKINLSILRTTLLGLIILIMIFTTTYLTLLLTIRSWILLFRPTITFRIFIEVLTSSLNPSLTWLESFAESEDGKRGMMGGDRSVRGITLD